MARKSLAAEGRRGKSQQRIVVQRGSRASAARVKREAAMLGAEVELSPEEEEVAERICTRIEEKVQVAVRQMVRRLVNRAPEELFGPGEFELRDGLHRVGALLVEEAANERATSKKGVPGS